MKPILLSLMLSLASHSGLANTDSDPLPAKEQPQEIAPASVPLSHKIHEASGTEPPILFVLLHGYGSNENDLFSLVPDLPDNYTVVALQAPYRIGPGRYQWYTGSSTGGGFDGDASQLADSESKVAASVAALQKRLGIPASRTFLAGFSQGANLSYLLGILHPELFRGIGVFSGTLFESFKKEHAGLSNRSELAIFAGHGDADDRIPYSAAKDSQTWLVSHHFRPEFHVYPDMGHSLSEQEISDFVAFVKSQTNPRP